MSKLLSLVLLATSASFAVGQNCQCGFKDNNGNVWRESIATTFSGGAVAALKNDWIVSTETLNQKPLGIAYVTQNVFDYQDGLGIKASAYDNSGFVKSGQIFTKRKDIQYGTFRMRAQIPSSPGAVFGFFTYISETQEQDIEFLTAEADYYQRVHYTNQPGRNPGATQSVVIPGADFTTFGEHRIDWLPGRSDYYYNGSGKQTKNTLTVQVPTTPSEFVVNVWSNGEPTWSQGPPTRDAIATLQWVHLYFNSTSLSAAQFNTQCTNAGRPAVCSI